MPRIYTRNQGQKTRYYGDFRDIGYGQYALIPQGSKRATIHESEAIRILEQKTLEFTGAQFVASSKPLGKVYFIRCKETGRVKIGWTTKPSMRLKALQTCSPTDLELVKIQPGTKQDEWQLHIRFAAHHIRGEWFTSEVLG